MQVLLLGQVGAVGHHGAHAKGQGEEHLARRSFQHAQKVGLKRLEVGGPHELVALARSGLAGHIDDEAQQNGEERGHGHGGEFLDAVLDAAHDDYHIDNSKGQIAPEHLTGICADERPEVQTLTAEAVNPEHLHQESEAVAQHDAAQRVIEAEDDEGRGNAHIAHPFVLLGQSAVCAHNAQTGPAADDQLAQHDNKAYKNDQKQVDQNECKAAVIAAFVWEAPDVAQSYGGADSRHQEPKIGRPGIAFVIVLHFFPS